MRFSIYNFRKEKMLSRKFYQLLQEKPIEEMKENMEKLKPR